MREVTDEKLEKYLTLTEEALAIAKKAVAKNHPLRQHAEEFLSMAENYLEDAKHFRNKGDYATALAAASYAHAWLDAGARLGMFSVKGNSRLFTVD